MDLEAFMTATRADSSPAAAADPERELKAWHLLPRVSAVDTTLQAFWQANENTFPITACLARKWCAVPASSAPCERLFSAAGRLLTDRRASMSDENLEMILFMHENIDIVENELARLANNEAEGKKEGKKQ